MTDKMVLTGSDSDTMRLSCSLLKNPVRKTATRENPKYGIFNLACEIVRDAAAIVNDEFVR